MHLESWPTAVKSVAATVGSVAASVTSWPITVDSVAPTVDS
jgi:hypothetical protein